jgi:hypothetical protein
LRRIECTAFNSYWTVEVIDSHNDIIDGHTGACRSNGLFLSSAQKSSGWKGTATMGSNVLWIPNAPLIRRPSR